MSEWHRAASEALKHDRAVSKSKKRRKSREAEIKELKAAVERVREVVEHDGYTVTLPTANWNTQLESMDDPYRAEVVLSADILEALEVPNE